MSLSQVEHAAQKYHMMATLLNIGVKKWHTVLSKYKADVYEVRKRCSQTHLF